MLTFTLKVVGIEKRTPDVVTIFLKQPGLKKIKYKPGQYLTLVVRINNRKYIRPYSFSSAPGIDQHLAVTIKRIPGGVVSNYLYDHVKIDDVMEVMEPMGDFVFDLNEPSPNHIMLWGAGSGITPLMSILKVALNTTGNKKVTLFYCNRNPEHTIFYDELVELEEKYPDRFKIYNFYTRIPEDVYLHYFIEGRIDETKVVDILSVNNDLEESVHYICGPDGLKQTVRNALSILKVVHANIYTEEFEVFIDAQQFDDIETRQVKIINSGVAQQIEVTKGTSILNAALDQGIDLSYSCQTGTCLLCKGKLVNGKVKLIGIDKLPEGLNADDCLLCCSYPYSTDIEILTIY
ncbi:ferredoxin--NADP reductase [Mucilaginibacter sp. HMF5004]|uniref:ferredoxin--NADP reductase n=1 Tax=Mucilaginibacter rivuli TaxID=2857527 RepID=UPI001C5F5121|nr:ferredoxin--NADP reductase [Mucilaginibacter rivuli]MBW4889896.1 ferredoxin--NADP reductase [Mucilaginibacter rivuli]